MSEENKALVRRFYEAFDQGGPDAAVAYLAPDARAYFGSNAPMDREAAKQMLGMFSSAFPDGHHTFEEVIAEGDRVVTRGVWRGTHRGGFMGIPPTGKQVAISVVHIDRVAEGKIAEHWGQGDMLGLLQQLGVVPPAGQAGGG